MGLRGRTDARLQRLGAHEFHAVPTPAPHDVLPGHQRLPAIPQRHLQHALLGQLGFVAMTTVLSIGVLCERRDIYNEAINYFKTGIGTARRTSSFSTRTPATWDNGRRRDATKAIARWGRR